MNIFINGHEFTFDKPCTVSDVLSAFLSEEQQKLSFAVALNSDFVGKDSYSVTTLSAGDTLDVLFPIQGG